MARQQTQPVQQDSSPRWNINFMRIRRWIAWFSIVSVILSAVALGWKGLRYGLDFTGGVLLEVQYQQSVSVESVSELLEANGFDKASVMHFGSEQDVLVRMPPLERPDPSYGQKVLDTLQSKGEQVTLKRVEFVGPQVGEDLQDKAIIAVLVAMGCILIYVAMRFEFKFAAGAVAGLGHDVIVLLGIFALMGWEFDLTVLAALLALIGYSLNDSIVVADRIRENFRKMRKGDPEHVVDYSINQTLDRTIITSLTVWVVALALYLLGGEHLRNFSMTLLIGVVIGTYSSIYVAANVALAMKVSREDFLPPVKAEEVDERP